MNVAVAHVQGLSSHRGPLGADGATHHHAGFNLTVVIDSQAQIKRRGRVKTLGDGGELTQDHREHTIDHGDAIVLFRPHRVAAFSVRVQAKMRGW